MRAVRRMALLTFAMLAGRVASAQVVPVLPGVPAAPAVGTAAASAAGGAAGAAAASRVALDSAIALARVGLSEQAMQQFRRSGVPESSIPDRLRAAGIPEAAIDALMTNGTLPTVPTPPTPAPAPVKPSAATDTTRSTLPRRPLSRIFGKDIFRTENTAFDPVTAGPVDAGFRLGVGDVLQLVVTGQVELALTIDVRRDGTVLVPQVAQIPVAGLTLEAAREVVRTRMGKSYAAIERGDAKVDLSLSRLRTNAVFVIGEIENPGVRQVSALATVFTAIAAAGGPTEHGSFRGIEIRRAGKVIKRLDLYEYLLTGDAAGDIRLEQGDVIFVPLNTRRVSVYGEVRRNKTFELLDSEGFNDLLRFAGGLSPSASMQRVQIDRILPLAERRAGTERTKVDVDVRGDLSALSRVRLFDGDSITVFPVGDDRRNFVKVIGEVYAPGSYEWRSGATLGAVVGAAQGFTPWAIANEVKVVRRIISTGQSEMVAVDATTAEGRNFRLEEFDEIEIGDVRTAFTAGKVSVEGAVNTPGSRDWVLRESLLDALRLAGGFKEDAQVIDIFRRRTGEKYSDTTSFAYRFQVTPDFFHDARAAAFQLERGDRVVVRGSPGFRAQAFATVAGLFRYPGTYAITEDVDRLKDVVERAGGALPGAYSFGFSLYRKGKPVSIEFDRAMRGDPIHNIPLLADDSLSIFRDPKTVLVTGAVSRPSLIRFQPGLSIEEYIEQAGGPTELGDPKRAVIDYPSGFSRRVQKVAYFWHSSPSVQSGATITVPANAPSDRGLADRLSGALTTASTIASLLVTLLALRKL